MFYSSQTGSRHSPTLADFSRQGGLAELIDTALSTAPSSSGCFWLDVVSATPQELLELSEVFRLHPLTTEDIQYGCSRDKLDAFDDYTSIIYHSIGFRQAMDVDSAVGGGTMVAIIMKPNCVLTFHHDAKRRHMRQVLNRLAGMHAVLSQPAEEEQPLSMLISYPPYIVYAILDEITDHLAPWILSLEHQVDQVDELVLLLSQNEQEDMLRRMGAYRRHILLTWRLIHTKPTLIQTLIQHLPPPTRLSDEVAQYLGDIHSHLLSAISSCSHAEAVLSRTHANYLAKISLELARATFDSNSTTERWTMLGTIVVPVNIVTSFLGVNLKVPGQDRDDTLNFFIVLACMVIYAITTLAFWRWRRVI
ncbi:hypothetical protein GQ54DRAFT_255704 [Martensiomyces pterosporus]|nr:hypothetical protein GQ54DRAFT_255704 [Martensiomyces pterosporus]